MFALVLLRAFDALNQVAWRLRSGSRALTARISSITHAISPSTYVARQDNDNSDAIIDRDCPN